MQEILKMWHFDIKLVKSINDLSNKIFLSMIYKSKKLFKDT